eukprot:gnl/TRDRNA2_/TRDRNA2_164592_c0_seq3.p1 gnl/TRDRNA2_/TRDRNA2_164592_c0~~gnl/TRDRNA2_/TRDRNA2_164592_c0_seq3.p1  ORF type:complete len:258 (+),score=29.14 gnl/TRDRNA2_/TRDRNA2_164592_c0_seq3:99-776(+)
MGPPVCISDGQAPSCFVFVGIYSVTGVPAAAIADTKFWVVVNCTEILPGAPQGPQETGHIAQTFEVTDHDEDEVTATASAPVGMFRRLFRRSPSREEPRDFGRTESKDCLPKAASSPRIVHSAQLGEVAPKASMVVLPLTWNHACEFLIGDANSAMLRFELISQEPSSRMVASQPRCIGSKVFAIQRLLNIQTHTLTRSVTFEDTHIHLRVKLRMMFLGDPAPAY